MNTATQNHAAQPSEARKKAYKLLGIAKRQLAKVRPGFTDEDYRHILFMNGAKMKDGKHSATTMSIGQLHMALKHCQDLGFRISKKVQRETPKLNNPPSAKDRDWRAPRIAKLNALWISLANAGVIQDRSEQAMRKYCTNNVPELSRFEWITTEQLNVAVEMLKKMHKQRGLDSYKTHLNSD